MSVAVNAALRECHRLRVYLRELQAEIDRAPHQHENRLARLEQARQTHHAHHDNITKLKLKQREDEGTLRQTEARLGKLEEQLTSISVQKEYAAKQSEIEQAKAKKSELEDAILATIVDLEAQTAAIPTVEQTWADAQAEFAASEKEAADRLEWLKAEQDRSRAELTTEEAKLPPEVKATYDTVVKAKGPDALAGAKARVCQGCHRKMTESHYSDLRAGAFRTCYNCGRLVYPVE